MPRAILLALGLVGLLYIGLQLAAQGVLGAALAGAKEPLADLADALFGPAGGAWLRGAVLLSVLGYLTADMLTSPRVIHALAAHGQLPRALAWIHPRFHTPAAAIGLYPLAVLLVAATGTFHQTIVLSTAGTLLLYLVTCLGVLRLRAKGVAQAGPPFVAPGGVLVPLAAGAIIVWLLASLSWQEMAATGGFVAVAALIYAWKADPPLVDRA